MADRVGVYNMALAHIGAKAFVESLTEDSNERKYLDAQWDNAAEAVLDDHDWTFASNYLTLALTDDDAQTPWIYQYDYPSDCIRAREIVRTSDDEKDIPFRVDLDNNGSGKVIHTDQEDAILRYTKRIINPTLFSAKAVSALAWKLASLIAIPLTHNLKLKQFSESAYIQILNEAKVSNFNENANREAPSPTLISARS